MDRKIDNMKISYDKMVGLLEDQLRRATKARQGESPQNSVELHDFVVEASETEDTVVDDNNIAPNARDPLVPSKPSSVRQTTSQAATRPTRSSVASTVANDDTVDMTKGQSKGRR